jgi:hypothetical protein
LPSRLDINSVDRFTAVLHAQMTILLGSVPALGLLTGTP